MNALLTDIKLGHVTISLDVDDYDELHADKSRSSRKNASTGKRIKEKRNYYDDSEDEVSAKSAEKTYKASK